MTDKYKLLIPSIVNELRNSDEEFELMAIQDTASNTEWLKNNFPIASWGRIDWSKVPESKCIRYSNDLELVSAFEKIVAQSELEGSLIVSWANARTRPIKINMDVFTILGMWRTFIIIVPTKLADYLYSSASINHGKDSCIWNSL